MIRSCAELDKTQAVIKDISGVTVNLFRPPHGWISPRMSKICRERGYTQVFWTLDPRDWQHSEPSAIVNSIIRQIKPGSIILLHDGLELRDNYRTEATVEALPAIIDSLSEHGYDFVTIPQMIEETQIQEDASCFCQVENPVESCALCY